MYSKNTTFHIKDTNYAANSFKVKEKKEGTLYSSTKTKLCTLTDSNTESNNRFKRGFCPRLVNFFRAD